jgi:gluconolactonase
MSWFPSPREIPSTVFASLPQALRKPRRTAWADANKGGQAVDQFLEGPCFAADGTLYLVDIPFGRILAIVPGGAWRVVVEYDGWPNGLKIRADGSLLVADYKNGLLAIDPATGSVARELATQHSESFKGLNDLALAKDGAVWFTDQGQTGLHDPTGRVYRWGADGALSRILANCPSPNGLAFNRAGSHLYVALTRAAQIWRVNADTNALGAKTQLFAQLPGGTSGPDGLVVDGHDRLIVCDPGQASAWVLAPHGQPLFRVASCAGRAITNAVLAADGRTLLMTDSDTGQILAAELPPGEVA